MSAATLDPVLIRIYQGESIDNITLQVRDIVPPSTPGSKLKHYCLLLSDAHVMIPCILHESLNDKIANGAIKTGSILRLSKWSWHNHNDRRVLSVVASGLTVTGHMKQINFSAVRDIYEAVNDFEDDGLDMPTPTHATQATEREADERTLQLWIDKGMKLIDEGIDHKFYDHDQGLQIKYKSRLYVEFDALIYKEAFHEKGDDCFAKKYGVCTIAACLKAKSTSKPLIALHINSDGEDHFALVQPGSVTNNGYKNNDDEPMHIEQLWREHVTNNGTTARPKKQRPASDDSELPSKSTRSRTREDSDSEDDRARKRHKSDNNLSNQVSPQLTELLADVASIGQNISALSATISSQHDKTSRQLVLLNNTTNAKHTAIEERLKSLSDEIKAVNSSIKTLDEVVQRILSHVKADAKEKEKVVVVQAPIPQMRQEPHYVVPPNYYSGTPSYNGPYNSPSSRFF